MIGFCNRSQQGKRSNQVNIMRMSLMRRRLTFRIRKYSMKTISQWPNWLRKKRYSIKITENHKIQITTKHKMTLNKDCNTSANSFKFSTKKKQNWSNLRKKSKNFKKTSNFTSSGLKISTKCKKLLTFFPIFRFLQVNNKQKKPNKPSLKIKKS